MRKALSISALILICALVAGCAGVGYILDNYSGVDPVSVFMPDDTYRVFEHRTDNRVMITPSLGAAGGAGFARGLTFGAINGVAPKPLFEAAVRNYLDKTSRQHCAITDGYILADPQYEFKFECKPAHGAKEPFTPYVRPADEDMPVRQYPPNVPR